MASISNNLESINIPDNSCDTVIVGAGPIGLWTAIQMKLLNDQKKITVIEKYREYQRRDIRLNIHASSLGGIPNDPELKKLIEKWPRGPVAIAEMQTALEKRASDLGITILKGYQANAKDLPALFPQAKTFIGADGARSNFRKDIFNDQFRFNSNLQYLAQVQYIINAPDNSDKGEEFCSALGSEEHCYSVGKVRDFIEKYSVQKFAEHVISQTIKPQADGSSKVTLQIFIDKDTYDQMGDATFRSPYYFVKDLKKVPDNLRDVLIKWWGAREKYHNETISQDPKNNKMTVIALNSSAAKEVIKKDEQGRVWAVVGDAAASFPYFRAINTGFLMGTQLASCLANEPYLNSYAYYAAIRVQIERIRAFVKNVFINLSKFWIRITNEASWELIGLTTQARNSIYKLGTEAWNRLIPKTVSVCIDYDVGFKNSLGIRVGPEWETTVPFVWTPEGWKGEVPIGKEFKFVIQDEQGTIQWEKLEGNRFISETLTSSTKLQF